VAKSLAAFATLLSEHDDCRTPTANNNKSVAVVD
jgi:hypothetical protein